MSGLWPYVAALIPSAGVGFLFYVVVKNMIEGDRKERLAHSQWDAAHDGAGPRDPAPQDTVSHDAAPQDSAPQDSARSEALAPPATGHGNTTGPENAADDDYSNNTRK